MFSSATFVNALRQQSARKLSCAIDQLTMVCSWGNKKSSGSLDGCLLPCIVSSLLLQGASYEGGVLRETSADASELQPAPSVTIGFVPIAKAATVSVEDTNSISMAVPVYLSPTREYFLMELQMSVTQGDRDKWVLAGAALFLSEDE